MRHERSFPLTFMSTRDAIAFVTRATEADMPIDAFIVDTLSVDMALVLNIA